MKTLADLAQQDWRYVVSEDGDEVELVRPDPDNPRRLIGPLATVSVGVTSEDDNGDMVLLLDHDDGRNLVAIAALPYFAELVVWAEAKLAALNCIHFDSTTEAGQFHHALKARLEWLRKAVDERDVAVGEGEYGLRKPAE